MNSISETDATKLRITRPFFVSVTSLLPPHGQRVSFGENLFGSTAPKATDLAKNQKNSYANYIHIALLGL